MCLAARNNSVQDHFTLMICKLDHFEMLALPVRKERPYDQAHKVMDPLESSEACL